MTVQRKELGRLGETLAERHLVEKGYQIIGRNVRFQTGELDLIAIDNDTLVFIEVRTRRGLAFGSPAESITWRKQRKLRELAITYLQEQNHVYKQFRFDVVLVEMQQSQRSKPTIEHFVYAF